MSLVTKYNMVAPRPKRSHSCVAVQFHVRAHVTPTDGHGPIENHALLGAISPFPLVADPRVRLVLLVRPWVETSSLMTLPIGSDHSPGCANGINGSSSWQDLSLPMRQANAGHHTNGCGDNHRSFVEAPVALRAYSCS